MREAKVATLPEAIGRRPSLPHPALDAILLLVLLPLLVQAPALTGWLSADPLFQMAALSPDPGSQILPGAPGWVDGNAGVTTQALGGLAAEDWLHGRVPWWNPYAGLGMPLAAEMQNSALFLPFVLLLHFPNGTLLLKIAMQMLTGLFMLALLRELGLGRRAGLLGAVLAEFCGTLAWFGHGPIMPVPFLPLLLLGIERSARLVRDGRPGGWPLVAVAIAGSIAAGFPETAFMDGLLGLCVAVWRIVTAGPRWRRLLGRIVGGGLLGLLLSMPAWLPFAESLPVSFLGQNADVTGGHLMRESYGLLLLPYLLGPILYGFVHGADVAQIWWHTGGYCDLVMVFVAALALTAGPGARQLGLRRVLAGWLLVSLCKAAGLPLVARAFELIPFIRQTLFHLYAAPGWEIALAILAALTFDDLHRGAGPSAARLWTIAAACAALAALAILLAWRSIHALALLLPGYQAYPLLSIAWAALVLALLCRLLAPGSGARAQGAAASLLAINAIVLFGVPILAGARHASVDLGPVRYLQQHLGLQRFYSLGRLAPNYGSHFRIAGLNWNAVPVPQALVARIGRDLDPDMDMSGLFGDHLHGLGPVVHDPAAEQITAATAITRLEALGVAAVVTPHGFELGSDEVSVSAAPGAQRPQPVANGMTVTGTLPAGLTGDATIRALGVSVGTYMGHPGGPLTGSICVRDECVSGHADLRDAIDNQPLWIPLDRPLDTRPGDTVTYRLQFAALTGSAAIWTVPLPGPPPRRFAPLVMLRIVSHLPGLQRVYADDFADIVRLPHPAPYFSSEAGRCDVQPVSREHAIARCSAPDRLVRRELFFPGWTAIANGRRVAPDRFDDTFQAVPLPAGRSDIRFAYAPPHVGPAWASLLLGLVILGGATLRRSPW